MSVLEVTARIRELRTHLGLTNITTKVSETGFAQALQSATSTDTDVIASAKKYLGVPYVFGSTNPNVGLDCSSFVQRAYADIGVKLPRLAKDQATQGVEVPSLAQARPGDLIAFNKPVDHIGIYVGDGKMIVAPHSGDVVKVQKVYETPSTIRRITPDVPVVTPAPIVRPASLSTSDVPYADLFKAAGAKYGLSPTLLAAVAKVESNFRVDAVSKAGAQGLMQLMPATAASMGVDAFDPAQAVDAAARILAKNLKDFGSLPLALAAYNAGGGAVRRYGGIPPFAETQAYVPKVQAAMAALTERGFA
jgi:hypothetical protein